MKTLALPYWGQIIGLVSQADQSKDSRSLFITRQQSPTAKTAALYILDNKAEQFSLTTTILPCAMQAILNVANNGTDDTIIMLGSDGHLYQTDWQAKKVNQISTISLLKLAAELSVNLDNSYAVAIATLHNALVILYPNQVIVWPYTNGKAGIDFSNNVVIKSYLAHLDATGLDATDDAADNTSNNRATTLATSSDGKWLVIGDKLGLVSSYQWSDASALSISHRHQSHQGAVSALRFEPIGQYFFSAGADKSLFRTHVQGDLHPIDRAKASQHSQKITALCVSNSRLFSAADDKVIKSWAFDKGQPNTCKEDLVKTRMLELSSYAEQPALIVVGSDQSLRFIPIGNPQNNVNSPTDSDHKLQEVAYIIKDGYQRVHDLLTDSTNNSDAAFKEGLTLLQSQADAQTLEVVSRLLASAKNNTTNNSSELTAEQALQLLHWVASTHLDKTTHVLEQQLNSPRSSKIRLAAFHALADRAGLDARPLQYLEQAIKSTYEEIIASAIQGYLKVAINNPDSQRRILPILQEALSHKMLRIRKQALASLEAVLPDDSPKADLLALDCSYPDVIQAGLIRLYQRDMLDSLEVARQLMRLSNNHNPEVRQTAFYISILAHPELVEALKQQASLHGDTQLIRTLSDFDDFRLLRGTLLDSADDSLNAKGTNTKGSSAKNANSDQIIDLSLSTQDFVAQNSLTDNKANKQKSSKQKVTAASAITLSDDSLEPLLQSLANSYEDISFRAAYALSCLQDKRAFGALIRLMHADNVVIRAGVALALGHLNMEDGKTVLPVLLDDKDAGVRMVAMKSFGKLADNVLSWVAVGFASMQQDIHEQALALFLTQVLADKSSSQAQLSSEMTAILLQALNNPFTSIRLEVVKVLLNRQLQQSEATNIISTIELLQQSLFADVHQVAIEEWQRSLLNTKSNQQSVSQDVLALFFADNFIEVRQQAFTIAVKNTRRLNFTDIISAALASPYADIKQLALSTLQAKASTSQLEQLLPALIGMLADDSIELRGQALKVALALTDLQPIGTTLAEPALIDKNSSASDDNINNSEALITAALASPYPDIQLDVAQLLASQSSNRAQNNKRDNQAYSIFEHYLTIAMPTQDKNSEVFSQWHQHISQALSGLAQLTNPAHYNALQWYNKFLHHADADFSHLAPKLMWLVSLDTLDTETTIDTEQSQLLVQWQKDERPIVSQSASLALAVWGDSHGQHFFTQTDKTAKKEASKPFSTLVKPLTPIHWLQAQQGLGMIHARQLRHVFDSKSYSLAARLLLIFNDIQQNFSENADTATTTQRPQQLIEALSFADNETAVIYANILARYPAKPSQNSLDDIWQYLSDYLTRKVGSILSTHSLVLDDLTNSVKGAEKDSVRATILQSVSTANLRQLAALSSSISFNSEDFSSDNKAQPLVRAQAIGVICHLSELLNPDNNDDEVLVALQRWQRSLSALLNTNKNIIDNKTLTDAANKAINNDSQYPYQTLAFGTWLGIIREGDDYYSNNHTTDQAIRGLKWLAMQPEHNDNNWQSSVSLVLLPLLNHNDFSTRELAWDSLHQLNVSPKKRADYALSTSHQDMVKHGLQLLLNTINANADTNTNSREQAITSIDSDANKQLITLLKTNNQSLAEETYRLLKQRIGLLPASLFALDSYCRPLTYQVVSEWQQVVVAPFASSAEALSSKSQNSEQLTKNQQRNDKLTFLQQATLHDDWRVRYRAFSQLVDFYEVLFADSRLFDALFEFWRDSPSWSDEKQVFSLIISALQSYKRVNNDDNSFDSNNAELIVDNTYVKLLNLLDYPQRKMPKLEIYQGLASLRDTSVVAALLQRLCQGFEHLPNQNKSERQQIFDTLVTISGYDQPIEDYLDESADKRWLQQQHPRHPQVLLALFTTLINYGDYEHAAQLLASLSWARATETINKTTTTSQGNSSIDAQLALAYEQLPAKYTFDLVQTLAYRAERRGASLASLQKALTNKNADVQFIAAEGLAKCGQAQGLTILMATVDYNTDGDLRRRSVLAIGELMGSRNQDGGTRNNGTKNNSAKNTANNNDVNTLYKAYDKLIKLAEDNEHYLQDVASEALGRLAQGDGFKYSSHIFELLKLRLLDPNLYDYNPAIEHWLNGLRWLNTLASWELIRSYIRSHLQQGSFFAPQTHAISLLAFDNSFDDSFDNGFNNSAASKTLLLDILKQNNLSSYELMITYASAQKLWGNAADTVYPYDWATLQNDDEYFLEEIDYLSLKRVTAHASIDELTIFISQHGEQLSSDTLTALQNAVMAKTDMSKTQLIALIEDSNARAQLIGLSYLAQYPTDYLDKDMFATLQHRFNAAKQDWQALIDTIEHSPVNVSNEHWLASIKQTASIINQVLWLICRYHPLIKDKANLKQMVESVTGYLSGTKSKNSIQQIIDWLDTLRQLPIINTVLPLATATNNFWQQALLALLARPINDDSLLVDLLPILRSVVTVPASQLSYANQMLLTTLIMRLEQDDKPLKNINEQAAISINQQLLLWIKTNDATALYDCAINEQSDISTQVRAIEALGQLHEPKIEQWLESLMKNEDEDIQKLAYKVLRRWQRAMVRAQQKRPSAFASIDVINSQMVTAISTQDVGDK